MIDIDGPRTPAEQRAIDRAVADFYATGGWTEARCARWEPFERLIEQNRARRAAAEAAAQEGPAEPEAPAEPAAA